MEVGSLAQWSRTLQTVVVATLIFIACSYLPRLKLQFQLSKLPIFGGSSGGEKQRQGYLASAKQIYTEGYEKVHTIYGS